MDPPASPPALSRPLTITNTSATANPSQAIPESASPIPIAGSRYVSQTSWRPGGRDRLEEASARSTGTERPSSVADQPVPGVADEQDDRTGPRLDPHVLR
jgi:hypothetical protein